MKRLPALPRLCGLLVVFLAAVASGAAEQDPEPAGGNATPEILRSLVDDVARAPGVHTPSLTALFDAGPAAVPFLMPLLESGDSDKQRDAVFIIDIIVQRGGAVADLVAADWIAIAVDRTQSLQRRLGVLFGLTAIGEQLSPYMTSLHPALDDPDADIARTARAIAVKLRDPFVLPFVARDCERSAQADGSWRAARCIREIETYGAIAREHAPLLLPLVALDEFRIDALLALAALGNADVAPALLTLLESADWRIAHATIVTLAAAGNPAAIEPLRRVASTHWLPPIRDLAGRAIAAIEEGGQRIRLSEEPLESMAYLGASALGDPPECPTRQWKWQDLKLMEPPSNVTELPFQGGTLRGSDHGEWGGELVWIGPDRATMVVEPQNIQAIASVSNGDVLVATGSAHMIFNHGAVVRFRRDAAGTWSKVDVVLLPAKAQWMLGVGDDLYAVEAWGWVVMLTPEKVLGVADCVH